MNKNTHLRPFTGTAMMDTYLETGVFKSRLKNLEALRTIIYYILITYTARNDRKSDERLQDMPENVYMGGRGGGMNIVYNDIIFRIRKK